MTFLKGYQFLLSKKHQNDAGIRNRAESIKRMKKLAEDAVAKNAKLQADIGTE